MYKIKYDVQGEKTLCSVRLRFSEKQNESLLKDKHEKELKISSRPTASPPFPWLGV